MAYICRITQTRVNRLISQLKTNIYRVSAPSLPDYLFQNRLPSNSNPQQIIGLLGSSNGFSVRFFAAPVQSKKKEEANKSKGPRLNEQIKSHMVRLVSDEGHEIVPFHVALDRAKSLNFDLVEVNCNAKPIVCKIMDYHRDKYQQQLKVKERSKNKAESSVRKGSCKEVRISLKIEQKDLEMKADMAKRLMERGYRVKCMVQGPSISEDDPKARAATEQKLKGLIDRLHALIEEVAFVESGPRVEKSQAFVLVRHIKFGPSKKGGKKVAKSVDSPTRATSGTSSPVQHPANFNLKMSSQHSDLGSDNEDGFSDDSDAIVAEEEVFDLGDQEKETVSPIVDSYSPEMTPVEHSMRPSANSLENRYSRRPPGPVQQSPQPGLRNNKERSFPGDPDASVAQDNRYSRQNATRTEGEGYMRPVRDRAQMNQAPNFKGPSENRYSRRPPSLAQQQQPGADLRSFIPPPPFREIPKNNPTTSDSIPSTSYGIYNGSSTSLPHNQPPINDGNSPVSGEATPDSPQTEFTNLFSGFLSRDGPKNANASPSGFMKPPSSSTRLPHNRPPVNGANSLFGKMKAPVSGPDSPSTKCTNILSGLLNADNLRNANATTVFGSMKTQGLPSARPNPGSPLTDKTEMFSGLLGSVGLKKTQVPPNVRSHPDSPVTKNTEPYSGLFDGDGSNVKGSRTFPTKPT